MSAERSQKPRNRLAASVASTRFAIEASGSLFKDVPSNPSVKHRPFVKELALIPVEGALNTEAELPGKFLSIVESRGIPTPLRDEDKKPYWMDGPYRTMDVVGTSVQYFDQHGAPLPETTLPPAQDVETFINGVLQEPEPVTVDRQFEMLLDITDNNVVGAANLGMLANRHMSRFGDERAYPVLTLDGKTYTPDATDDERHDLMAKWNAQIAKFEVQHDPTLYEGRRDGTGDSYYFWTHFFAATMFGSEGFKSKAFAKGNELMIFARDKIGNRGGIVSTHSLSSKIGRNIGLTLAEGHPGSV